MATPALSNREEGQQAQPSNLNMASSSSQNILVSSREHPLPYLPSTSPTNERPLTIINNIYVNSSGSSRNHPATEVDPVREMLSILDISPIMVDEILRCIAEVPKRDWPSRLEYCGIHGPECAIILDIMASAFTATGGAGMGN